MKIYITVALFFLCNITGFFTGSFMYAVAQIYRFINIEETGFSIANMQYDMGVVLMMWAACAVFSFASFFLSRKWKIVFLAAPVIAPLISSLILISAYI